MPADLHCHTNRSDGSDSPEYVIRFARQLGLSALAITDHDYYAARYDAEGLGKSLGLRVINGVECSTFDKARGHKVHILCYNIKHYDAVSELLTRGAGKLVVMLSATSGRIPLPSLPMTSTAGLSNSAL